MKYLAIVVLCGLAAVALAEFTPEQKEKFQQRIKECQAESGLAPDAVEKLKSGQATVEPTPEYKSYANCVTKKGGFINDKGETNEPLVIETLTNAIGNKEKAEQIVKDCKAKEPSNKDDLPFHMFKCYLEAKAQLQ